MTARPTTTPDAAGTDRDGESYVFSWTIRREDLINRRFDRGAVAPRLIVVGPVQLFSRLWTICFCRKSSVCSGVQPNLLRFPQDRKPR